ncbi:probable acetoin dehydrogenase beta subunit (plasmid) [Rhodococcus jostii RHA1]|jgi:pyruvate/2-oxoglutarate/acetoin dehydrogenase E1 component|uniref:Acetoin dehydrogenase beta subunit n=2 Tax=Rhodococcus TaxID=1827 RepID=I0WIV7_RHOOP|nr:MULTISPECIES: transketolase C-terminal domain-containing protein [Rhodococcus]ABG99668.1 probable acetoin dehydrogenase beta subunit [Rhodococcus jostii RHA1]EID76323.1 acetoin dehydrogenase beta subunit [Rhodococcus opacus RKJ300 = JCM 13270]QQZ18944.1 acetoin dehydrogenase [Rhodococcus sp. 21391]
MPDTKNLSYAGAVNEALRQILDDDPKALVFGEDVAAPGGVFGVTKGLQKTFGRRVFDTPISESAILGGAVGSALFGMRPIVEIMWADFTLVAFDQLVNQAANVRYVSQGALTAPITVRMQQGSAPGACAQHSQSLEALFAHIPGLQVCMPATHQDAYDLLLTAAASPDPTIVIENRTLYHRDKQPVTLGGPVAPLGGAVVRREGTALTAVTWGAMQFQVLEAADALASRGIDIEVIDARWLRPLDMGHILSSVARTRRLAVIHEAHTIGGVGAEIVAAVAAAGIELDQPPLRIGTPDARIPAAPSLAQALIPNADRIIREIDSAFAAHAAKVSV